VSEPDVEELTVVALTEDADVFTARHLGRDLAQAIGLDRIDATRFATAISELAREAAAGDGGRLAFGVRRDGGLVATIWTNALGPEDPSIRSTARLVDSLSYETVAGEAVVKLTKTSAGQVAETALERMRGLAAAHVPVNPFEELRQQNTELLTLLDAVRANNAELKVLNQELEDTNRGVMALYTELSDELERTNQGVVALYAEIDDKNAQLIAASEAKSRFLRSISHELRTPVNAVLGLTRLLTDPAADSLSADQAEQVQLIRSSATDLLTLVNELLDLAKAESGRMDPVARDVDVVALCDGLRDMIAPLLREGVRLVIDPVPDRPIVRTDPDLVRHVLRNLLSNAAKFTTTGSVRIAAETGADGTSISVIDTGMGMTEEERSRVFEEFFQARTPLHTTVKGTGLGLSFALRVAQALGGTIDVESTPGSGSRFTLRLPAQLPEPPGQPEQPEPA
jgi:signal transduction histidine kinase